jgi:ubiquinone/menaquinone biosynthesis C-methylase UbiE
MVHALRETWRVLTPGGLLLDMRPRPQSCAIELVCGTDATVVGTVAENAAFIARAGRHAKASLPA